MRTTISKRGQTSVPAEILKKYNLKKGSKLYWLDTGKEIKVIPIPEDIIKATYKIAEKEGLYNELMDYREKEKLNGS